MADDFFYSQHIVDKGNGIFVTQPYGINSPSEICDSLVNIRYWHNSRLGNALFIVFYYLGGFFLVEVINTAALFFALLVFSRLWANCSTPRAVIISILACTLLVPVWNRTCVWHDASMGYTVGFFFLSLFLLGFKFTVLQNNKSIINICYTTVAAIFCGWIHEGCGLPLLATIISYWIALLIRKKHCNNKLIILYVLFIIIPSIWLLTAPGLHHRVSEAVGGKGLSCILAILGQTAVFTQKCWLPIFIILYAFWKKRNSLFDDFFFYLVLMYCGLAMLSSSGWGGAFFFPCLAMICFILKNSSSKLLNLKNYQLGFVIVFLLLSALYQMNKFSQIQRIFQTCLFQAHFSDIVECNLSAADADARWMLTSALPSIPDSSGHPLRQNMIFTTIFQNDTNCNKNTNNNIFQEENILIWQKQKNYSIIVIPPKWILLPQNSILYSHQHGYDGDLNDYHVLTNPVSWEYLWLKDIINQKYCRASAHKNKDFTNVFLDGESNDFKYITIKLLNIETGITQDITVYPDIPILINHV